MVYTRQDKVCPECYRSHVSSTSTLCVTCRRKAELHFEVQGTREELEDLMQLVISLSNSDPEYNIIQKKAFSLKRKLQAKEYAENYIED
jgi:hypothetical protein